MEDYSICTGDYVFFKSAKPNEGWLGFEGILGNDCYLTSNSDLFENCIWQVYAQNQYSAATEYEETFVRCFDQASHDVHLDQHEDYESAKRKIVKNFDPRTYELLTQLHRAAVNEIRLNEKLMTLKMGKSVSFGDVIQLRHVRSGKFLTVSARDLAKFEKENMRVSVSTTGDVNSYLSFSPRYKSDKEGQRIVNGSEVYIRVAERPEEYIHAAKKTKAALGEINCSLDSTSWSVVVYHPSKSLNSNAILAGSLISLQDPDFLGSLTVETRNPGIADVGKVVITSHFNLTTDEDSENLDTGLLWLIEKANFESGGQITTNDMITLKDLNSGLFLQIRDGGVCVVKGRENATKIRFHTNLNSEANEVGELLEGATLSLSHEACFVSYLSKSKEDAKNIQILNIECKSSNKQFALTLMASCAIEKKIGRDLFAGIEATTILREFERSAKQLLNRGENDAIPQDVQLSVGFALRNLFSYLDNISGYFSRYKSDFHDKYDEFLNLQVSNEIISRRQRLFQEQTVVDVLLDLVEFTTNNLLDKVKIGIRRESYQQLKREISSRSGDGSISKDGESDKLDFQSAKQKRESFGLREAPPSDGIIRRSSGTIRRNSGVSEKNKSNGKISVSAEVCTGCLRILFEIIRNNPTNQIYVSNRMNILIRQIEFQDWAVLCLQEMLRNNLTILQTRVRQHEIDMLLNMLLKSRMNVTYLRLLTEVCTTVTNGVDSTQRLITCSLFRYLDFHEVFFTKSEQEDPTFTKYSPLLINISVDNSYPSLQVWRSHEIYVPLNTELALESVNSFDLFLYGIPQLYVSWECQEVDADYSLLQLYGRNDKVQLDIVCSPDNSGEVKKSVEKAKSQKFRGVNNYRGQGKSLAMNLKNNSKSKSEMRTQVSDYLISQIYLLADLCLDRNYVSINLLENGYSYDMLLTILKMENVPNKAKAPVCRLLRCLYIDREPQVKVKYPRLIRTAASLKGSNEKFDRVSSNLQSFGLLQIIISEYAHTELMTSPFDECSYEMTKLLDTLISFGFYSDEKQIHDIMGPIISCLSRNLAQTDVKKQSSVTLISKIIPSDFDSKELNRLEKRSNSLSEDATKSNTWEYKYLAFSESILSLCIVLVVVLITVTVACVQIFVPDPGDRAKYKVFDYSVSGFFFTELSLRIFCHIRLKGNIIPYFVDPFNFLDLTLVLLDITLISLGSQNSLINTGRMTRLFRVIRLLRLFRVVRAAKLVRTLAEKNAARNFWAVPERFLTASEQEIQSKINILSILSKVYDRIHDKKLEKLIKIFVLWCEEEALGKAVDPVEIYNNYISSDPDNSEDIPPNFDDILLDTMMYSDATLVQESLNLLRIHKSTKQLMFALSNQVQIIYSAKMESICFQLTENLRDIKKLGEMYEIWSGLNKPEHIESGNKVLKLIETVIDLIKRPNEDRTLDIKVDYLVDEEAQKILFNLDFMSVTMSCLEAFYNGGVEEIPLLIKTIMSKFCTLICWYVKNCEPNQRSALCCIDWMMERTEDLPELKSSLVVREVLRGNKEVIKQFPRKYIGDFAKKIVRFGHKPEYLDIFLGLVENNGSFDSSVHSVENEVVRYLTGREWKHHILLWCSPPDSPGYRLRKESMEKCGRSEVFHPEELDPELQYHLSLLNVLSSCNLGPKLQAIYHIDDIVPAIVDPSTIFLVRIALGNILLQCVKSDISILQCSESIWNFFLFTINYLEKVVNILPPLFKKSSGTSALRIIHGKWLDIVFTIIPNFFEYFDLEGFNVDNIVTEDMNIKITKYSGNDIIKILRKLSDALDKVVEVVGHNLGKNLTDHLHNSINSVAYASGNFRSTNIPGTIEESENIERKSRLSMNHRNSVSHLDLQQLHYKRQFSYFVEKIHMADSQSNEAVDLFERIHSQYDSSVESDIRIEPLCRKLSSHLRSQIKATSSIKTFDANNTDTALWILKTFRQLMEKHIHCNLENGVLQTYGIVNVDSAEKYRNIFAQNAIIDLSLDFLSVGIHNDITTESLRLLTVLLVREGGCPEVQDAICKYLVENDSTLFFEFMRETISSIMLWAQKVIENRSTAKEKAEQDIPSSMIIFNFIQLMCEGENPCIRNLIREQNNNAKNIDIFSCLSNLLDYLSRYENPLCTFISIHALRTCQKLMSGPCVGNQELFVIHTELLVSLNRYIRLSKTNDSLSHDKSWDSDLERLKESAISVLNTSIEGQSSTSVVFEKVSTTVEFNVFSMILLPTEQDLIKPQDSDLDNDDLFELSKVQARYLVFMNSLGENFVNLLPPLAVNICEKEIRTIEIVWNGHSHSVCFHIPPIVSNISEKSMSTLLDEGDEELSHEVKLTHFMEKARTLFKEAEHQRFLFQFGISNFVNDSVRYYTTWIMFLNAVVMNVLIVVYFGTMEYDDHHMPHHRNLAGSSATGPKVLTSYLYINPYIDHVILGLNYFQVFLVVVVLFIYFVGTMPVYYSRHREKNENMVNSLMNTILDPLPVWYMGYLALTLLAINYHRLMLSALLLDWIVLDSTTRDVLRAVQYPARQLGATLIIILILLNMFAGIIFYFYRHDVIEFSITNMWESFKLCLAYGIRGEYGVSHEMYNSLGHRVIFDMLFYFIILAILRHIFFAVIVDTFGKLREIKLNQDMHRNNSCFICGVERQDIDKVNAIPGSMSTFNYHKSVVHDPYNYLYYMIYLWQQPLDEDNGIEMHVRKCISKRDTNWFPVGSYHSKLAEKGAHRHIEGGHTRDASASKGGNKELNDKLSLIQNQLNSLSIGTNTTSQSFAGEMSPTRQKTASIGSSLELNTKRPAKSKDSSSRMKEDLQFILKNLAQMQDQVAKLQKEQELSLAAASKATESIAVKAEVEKPLLHEQGTMTSRSLEPEPESKVSPTADVPSDSKFETQNIAAELFSSIPASYDDYKKITSARSRSPGTSHRVRPKSAFPALSHKDNDDSMHGLISSFVTAKVTPSDATPANRVDDEESAVISTKSRVKPNKLLNPAAIVGEGGSIAGPSKDLLPDSWAIPSGKK